MPLISGIYDVLMDNMAHCPMVSDTIVWSPSVKLDPREIQGWILYPNPTTGEFFLDFGRTTTTLLVHIDDALGVWEKGYGMNFVSEKFLFQSGEMAAVVYYVWFRCGNENVGHARLTISRN